MGDPPPQSSPVAEGPPGPFSRLSENAPTPLIHPEPEPEPSQTLDIDPANVGSAGAPGTPDTGEEDSKPIEAENAPQIPPASGAIDNDVEMHDASEEPSSSGHADFTPGPSTAASSPSKMEAVDLAMSQSNGSSHSGANKKSLTNGLKSATSSAPSSKKGKGKTKVDELKGTRDGIPDSRSATPPTPTTPTQYTSPSGAPVDGRAVYCICRRPYDEEEDEGLMVGCESCDGWYHAECVGLDEDKVDLLDVYICKSCERSTAQRTMYKQACKRDGCYKSVAGSNSKFCSARCAYRYSQAALGAVTSKQSLKQLTKGLANFPSPNLGVSIIHHIPPTTPDVSQSPYDDVQFQLSMIQSQLESTLKAINIIQKRQAVLSAAIEKCDNLTPIVFDDGAPPKKSKKKGGGPAPPKEDKPCGWVVVLIAEDEEVDQGVKGHGAGIVVEGAEEWQVCMLPRRKCDRHQGWQKTIASRTQNSLLECQRSIEEALETQRISTEARDSFVAKRDSVKRP
ncbi:hypothetical protein L198_06073 [Cryptococcus wingfieldii CBS 7118]|uniref:PHD-type domain-containing protein n=1 Tax=Cryptococcus wingfieldii CBS 7118 TaxID=1295528 RepID=A0A1E3IQ76_9TREE|nr:hypothetical protein L198_06073 [Cryptococcus wingfieldii CBS 7118]ODN90757.1 hypothetical protein L198_06073 [Cryptococcus wingfieldii CBS 7118]